MTFDGAAPTPHMVVSAPRLTLNRPVPCVRYYTTSGNSAPKISAGLLRALVAALGACRLARNNRRQHVVLDGLLGHHDLGDVVAAGDVVHHRQQDFFHDRAQAAGPGAAVNRLLSDRFQGILGELELDVVHLEKPRVLLDQGVLGLGQDFDQRFHVQVRDRGDYRQPADEFGNQPVFDQIFGHYLGEVVGGVVLGLGSDLGSETQTAFADPIGDDLLQPSECARHDEQHVGRIDLNELLVRVLAAALRRHRRLGSLQNLQQRLLHAFSGDIASDRWVLALAGDLVDLVDVDDARLGALDVVVGGLDQFEQNVFDVLTDVAGLGQRGGVRDRERDVEHLGEGLGQVGLAAASGAQHQDVGLGQLDGFARPGIAALLTGLDPLVMVVDSDGECPLGGVLADDVALQEVPDLGGLGQFVEFDVVGVGEFLFDDLVAQIDAFIADVYAGPRNKLLDLLLTLSAERALQQVTAVSDARHGAGGLLPVHRFDRAMSRVFPDATRLLRSDATVRAE